MSYLAKDYMRKDFETIEAGDSADKASKVMMDKGIGFLIVLEKGQPAGIVTEHDLVLKVMAKEKDPAKTLVFTLMSTPLITIDLDTEVEKAVQLMAKHNIRRLPVVRDNIIYGIFTARDLIKHFSDYEDKVTKDLVMAISLFSPPL